MTALDEREGDGRHPDELLRFFASVVRAARQARNWSQAKLAREAGVSLAHVGLLEKGRNVTVVFLSKIANALDLTISLSDAAAPTSTVGRDEDLFELIRGLDHVATVVADLRAQAVTAVLSFSARGKLKETPAVAAFIDRVLKDEVGVEKLAEAMDNLSKEARVPARLKPTALPAPRSKRAKVGGAGGK